MVVFSAPFNKQKVSKNNSSLSLNRVCIEQEKSQHHVALIDTCLWLSLAHGDKAEDRDTTQGRFLSTDLQGSDQDRRVKSGTDRAVASQVC